MSYLLDANVFIQAKNQHYGLDFCPAFWHWLREQHVAGRVFSIDKVADEILVGDDELCQWLQQQPRSLFRQTDAKVATHFATISNWVFAQNYEPAAINTFLQVADYCLVAHALAQTCVLVTHEVPANSTKRIKLPNVCAGLGLRFMSPYAILRRERARFVLGAT